MPVEFALEKNYAYPFNSSTKISYQISQTGKVSLRVFGILGNEIATLVNEENPRVILKHNLMPLNSPADYTSTPFKQVNSPTRRK